MPGLEETLSRIRPLDREAMGVARHHQNNLAKSLNGLGRLEEMAVHLAGIVGEPFFQLGGKAIIVAAADHGVVEEGVNPYPAK